MRLETKRLILRKPRKEDWEDIVEGVGNLEVSRNLAVVPYPYDKKEAMKWIAKCIREKKTNNYIFFIELKSEEKVIGVTQIHIMEGVATTASWINKKYWRKGYSLESKVSVLDFAFKKLKLRKIESKVFVENIASNEMLKKLGFISTNSNRAAFRNYSCQK